MSIFNLLGDGFSIATKTPPASEYEIQELEKFSPIPIPSDYLAIVRQAAEMEIIVKNRKCIRIWSPTGSIELNSAYKVQEFIPKSLAIGDDEGGNALLYAYGNDGFGLYMVGFGDMVIEDAVKIAPSLSALLYNNVGLDTLLTMG